METLETHIQKIREVIQLFKKHDTSITLTPDKWVSVFSVMEEYASIKAEQARREERGKSFEMLQSCLSFIEELKNHGIDNWSDEDKLRSLIKKATTI